jgi:hypothetical protein
MLFVILSQVTLQRDEVEGSAVALRDETDITLAAINNE